MITSCDGGGYNAQWAEDSVATSEMDASVRAARFPQDNLDLLWLG